MRLLNKNLQPVTVVKVSGERFENIRVNLQSSCGKVLTTNFEIPFEEGDIIERTLRNGITEQYEITQVNQSQNVINLDIEKIIKKVEIFKESEIRRKVRALVLLGKEAIEKNSVKAEIGVVIPDIVSGSTYEKWINETQILSERYLQDHPLFISIQKIYNKRNKTLVQCNTLLGYLEAVSNDEDYWKEKTNTSRKDKQVMTNKVFIVHGHNDAVKQEMARTLENGGFQAIILHEQASVGMTLIEKIESYTDVDYAVVLYTECDLGRDKSKPIEDEKYRARQNVVFEHGYLMAKLGRDHVTALVKGNVETPSDITGVVYTSMDAAGAWKFELAKNMQAVGIDIDLNKFLK